ncbi:hypothetical protein K438DRAFT_1759210 [Mycena galopus ATCC 62051]|nr:hypothetical protein K438DRAFT_1759210 [Mycena galopus ATCC 62051]
MLRPGLYLTKSCFLMQLRPFSQARATNEDCRSFAKRYKPLQLSPNIGLGMYSICLQKLEIFALQEHVGHAQLNFNWQAVGYAYPPESTGTHPTPNFHCSCAPDIILARIGITSKLHKYQVASAALSKFIRAHVREDGAINWVAESTIKLSDAFSKLPQPTSTTLSAVVRVQQVRSCLKARKLDVWRTPTKVDAPRPQ